jgi:hypothetical protein
MSESASAPLLPRFLDSQSCTAATPLSPPRYEDVGGFFASCARAQSQVADARLPITVDGIERD